MQDNPGPVRAHTPSRITEDANESDYRISSSPVSSFSDETQASDSVAMTSYISSLLEMAFTVDYDQYGIPGSPTGSLASVDGDAVETASEFAVTSSPSPIPLDNSVSGFVVCAIPA